MKNFLKIGIFAALVIGLVIVSGCTSGMPPAAPVTTAPTPQTTVAIVAKAPIITQTPITVHTIADETRQKSADDAIFLNFLAKEGILNSIHTIEMSCESGACDMKTPIELNIKLINGPVPASTKLQQYRSSLMTGLSHVGGLSNDLSKLKDAVARANLLLAEYNEEVYATTGASFSQSLPIGVEYSIKNLGGTNVIEIANTMQDAHNFTVSYDTYKGDIKLDNKQSATGILNPGESDTATLNCYSECTAVTITKFEILNETSQGEEEIRGVEV